MRIWIWNRQNILSVVFLLIMAAIGHVTTSYSMTCVRCLQHGYGVDRSIWIIRYWHSTRLDQSHGGLMSPAVFSPPISQIDPRVYEAIAGHKCSHVFKRGGACHAGFFTIACGTSGRSRMFQPRIELVESVYRAYQRVPDTSLARETLTLVDKLLPVDDEQTPRRRMLELQGSPENPDAHAYQMLKDGLGLVISPPEWRQLLDAAAHPGKVVSSFFTDVDALAQRLVDQRVEARLQALNLLAMLDRDEAWEAVVQCLDDEILRDRAVANIVSAKKWKYMGVALRQMPPVPVSQVDRNRRLDSSKKAVKSYPQEFLQLARALMVIQIRELMAQQDTDVDRFCMAAIRLKHQFDMLDDVLACLNRTGVQEAADAIEDLLLGPDPYNEPLYGIGRPIRRDPWVYLRDGLSNAPPGAGYTNGGQRAITLDQTVKRLGRERRPEHWAELERIYVERIYGGGSSWVAAGIAQAMYECDPERTRDFLLRQIASLPGDNRVAQESICSAGQIADPAFLLPLEALQTRTGANSFAYQAPLAYALHRCRGIHHWSLVRDVDGRYSIVKPSVAGASSSP